jgi:hypothetical protein
VPITRCASCGRGSFSFARRTYFAHCSACGKPLNGHRDMTGIESEIRERLYGRRGSRSQQAQERRAAIAP